jgi:hypothetical protein
VYRKEIVHLRDFWFFPFALSATFEEKNQIDSLFALLLAV